MLAAQILGVRLTLFQAGLILMRKLKQILKLASSYRYSPAVLPALWTRARTGVLPNTREANRAVWGMFDWSIKEDMASKPGRSEWTEGVVENLLLPFIGTDRVVLEIGPGGGRWTQHILPGARKTILVDLTPECIEICRERFGQQQNLEFHVNDGRTLPFIESASVDRIWSLDVFVHIQSQDIESYIAEFARVMSPGAEALVHHARNGQFRTGWRSDMTAEHFRQLVERNGLEMIDQFDSWGEAGQRLYPGLETAGKPDIISTFRKPA